MRPALSGMRRVVSLCLLVTLVVLIGSSEVVFVKNAFTAVMLLVW